MPGEMPDNTQPTRSRPVVMIGLALVLALFQITHAVQVLQLPKAVSSRSALPVGLDALLSLGWGVVFVLAAIFMVIRTHSGLIYGGVSFITFVIYSLLRLGFFAQADYDEGRLPFLIISGILLFTLPVFALIRIVRQRLNKERT